VSLFWLWIIIIFGCFSLFSRRRGHESLEVGLFVAVDGGDIACLLIANNFYYLKGLDQDLLAMLPQPLYALILCIPTTAKSEFKNIPSL